MEKYQKLCQSILPFGKAEDKPAWWPKKPKWKKFRNPSKASKEECTLLITLFLEGEMYENPSNCNAEHETDDENFGQDERRRREKLCYDLMKHIVLHIVVLILM